MVEFEKQAKKFMDKLTDKQAARIRQAINNLP